MTWDRRNLKTKSSSMWNGKQNHEMKEGKSGEKDIKVRKCKRECEQWNNNV
jgi:hypothetical protein